MTQGLTDEVRKAITLSQLVAQEQGATHITLDHLIIAIARVLEERK